jgi:hypothetical protein
MISALFAVALAVCAFAFPTSPGRPAAGHTPQGRPAQPARNGTAHHFGAEVANYNPTQYSINWAGAVYDYEYPAVSVAGLRSRWLQHTNGHAQGTWKTVSGTFNIPVPTQGNKGTQSYYGAAAWVGIDGGFQCEQAIWQIGVLLNYYEDGSVYYWRQ